MSKRPAYFAFISVFLLSLQLSGCGFALRGSTTIPPQFQPLYVSADLASQEFAQSVRRQLEINNVGITPQVSQANLRIDVKLLKHQRYSIALDREARDAEYRLFEHCQVSLFDAQGKLLRPPQQLEQRRIIVNDTDNPVGEQTESSIVRQEMLEQLSIQVARQIELWVEQLASNPS